MKIAVTGANSSVGQNLLEQLKNEPEIKITAGVRSERAFSDLPKSMTIDPHIIAYDDPASLETAMADADCVVHLAGILIEAKNSKLCFGECCRYGKQWFRQL